MKDILLIIATFIGFIFAGVIIGAIVVKYGAIVCGGFLVACAAVVCLADYAIKRDAKRFR